MRASSARNWQCCLAGEPMTMYDATIHRTPVGRTSRRFHLTAIALLVLTWQLVAVTAAGAASATATWNANTESDIAGYRLSYGTQSGSYTTVVDVGKVTSYVVTNLTPGTTYYFAVQAYDTSGLVSGYSTEVSFTATAATPPTITSVSPNSGSIGTAVTIAGSNFGASKGTSTVTFNGTAATPTSWSASSIVVPVPTGATSGNVVVTVGGVASNGVAFTLTTPAPTITSLSPSSGAVGTSVTINGSNFGASKGTSIVTFNGTAATPTSWSASSIVVPVPTGATTGNVVVTVGGVASNGTAFTVTTGTPTAITLVQHASADAGGTSASLAFPSANAAGDLIAVAVRAFTANQTIAVSDSNGNSYARAVAVNNASDDTLAIFYAPNIAAGANRVTVSVSASASIRFAILEYAGLATASPLDVTAARALSSSTPDSGVATSSSAGELYLGVFSTQSYRTYTAGNGYTIREAVSAAPSTALMVEDMVQATAGANSASATLSSSDIWAGAVAVFKPQGGAAPAKPTISSLSPASGAVGTAVTIAGSGFGASQGSSTVAFNGTHATPTSWSANSIVVPVPTGATSGNVVVTVGGVASNGAAFTVTTTTATISSLSPSSGAVGTSVTINGANFGASQGSSTVTFNGTKATPASWSGSSIVVPVPTGATSGNVVVTVGGAASNGAPFTVTTTTPTISSLSPSSGSVGTSVTISGANFGASQGSSTVAFNGTNATPTSWSASSIVVPVPKGATSGNVVVTVGGVASNGVPFTVTTATMPTFQQMNYQTPQTSQTAVSVPFKAAQAAGDTNVVIVGWNDATAQVVSVVDSNGNTYVRAVGPTVRSGSATQSIYYASNIAAASAGANAVTVTFTTAARYADIRIAEYSGIDPVQPVDTVQSAQGSGSPSSTPAITTTSPNDMLVAANTVQTHTTAPGSGFTTRVITSPDGDLLEDQVAPTAQTYSVGATLYSTSWWVMQVVAFRAASVPAGTMTAMATTAPVAAASLAPTTDSAAPSAPDAASAPDQPVVGDFDGDGKTDVGLYRASSGLWQIVPSHDASAANITVTLGSTGDTPVVGDYDGDGRADAAVFNASSGTWSVLTSSSQYAAGFTLPAGAPGDVAAAGDYDGDGKTDIATYRPSTGTWTIRLSSAGYAQTVTVKLGASGDVPVPADFDGDGKTDVAVYRPSDGTWRIRASSTGRTAAAMTFGAAGDVPVPGDYDGDGRADLALFRPSDSTWHVLGSSTGFTSPTTIPGPAGASGTPMQGRFSGAAAATPAFFSPDVWQVLLQKGWTSVTITPIR